MEGDPLDLAAGHVHEAWMRAFPCLVEVGPTPRAGFWHLWLRGPQSQATAEPLPSDLVPELLEEWGFSAEEWRHWRVNPQPTNPGLRPWPTIAQPTGPTAEQD